MRNGVRLFEAAMDRVAMLGVPGQNCVVEAYYEREENDPPEAQSNSIWVFLSPEKLRTLGLEMVKMADLIENGAQLPS